VFSRWSCALAAVGGASQLTGAHTGSRVRFLREIRDKVESSTFTGIAA